MYNRCKCQPQAKYSFGSRTSHKATLHLQQHIPTHCNACLLNKSHLLYMQTRPTKTCSLILVMSTLCLWQRQHGCVDMSINAAVQLADATDTTGVNTIDDQTTSDQKYCHIHRTHTNISKPTVLQPPLPRLAVALSICCQTGSVRQWSARQKQPCFLPSAALFCCSSRHAQTPAAPSQNSHQCFGRCGAPGGEKKNHHQTTFLAWQEYVCWFRMWCYNQITSRTVMELWLSKYVL